MEFFIKQNTDLPLLKLQIVKDGKQEYDYICNLIERSAIYFSMIDDATGNPKIINGSAGFVNKVFLNPNSEPEYYLYYKFNKNEVNKLGRYRGEFTLISDEGTLVVPIADSLFINVPENFVSEGCDDNCGEYDFPCCPDDPPLTYSFELTIIISSGSVIIDYELVADKPLITDLTLSLKSSVGVYKSDPIILDTEIKINSGEISGSTREVTQYDYDFLSGDFSVYDVNLFFMDRSIDFNIDVKPIIFKPPVQIIEDALLIDKINEYFIVGDNFYLSYEDPIQIIDDAILTGVVDEYISIGDDLYLSYEEVIDDAILTGVVDEYISIGDDLYLSYEEVIDDAILTGIKNQYIQVGKNLYLSYVEKPNIIEDAILTEVANQYIEIQKNIYLSYKELFIDNAILVDEKNRYIKIGNNLYLAFKK